MHRPFIIFIVIMFFFMTSLIGQVKDNDYKSDWDKVAQYDKKDLPQSAAKEVKIILQKAINDKNTQQVIKALLLKNKYEIAVDKNDNVNIFSDLNVFLSKSSDDTYKAIVHSLLAELYFDYYESNKYTFGSRKLLKDTIPTDMNEWTSNIFSNKIAENIRMSVANVNILKKHTTGEYADIIEQGADNTFYPTLYDFLMKRAIEIAEKASSIENGRKADNQLVFDKMAIVARDFIKLNIEATPSFLPLYYYKQYLADLLDRNMVSTTILTEISKAKYIMNYNISLSNSEKALLFLQTLYAEYANDNTSVVIIESIINQILSQGDSSESRNKYLEQAHEWCSRGLNLYAGSPLIKRLVKIEEVLDTPQLDIDYRSIIYPDSNVILTIHHKNLQSLKKEPLIEIYKIEGKNQILKNQIHVGYSRKTYLTEQKTINIGKLEVGSYLIKRKGFSDDSESKMELRVTQIAAFSRNNARQAYEVYVVDRMTGQPISNATVSIYNEKNENKEVALYTSQTDINGLASFSEIKELNNESYFNGVYSITVGKDRYPNKQINTNYTFRENDNNWYSSADKQLLSIFTDRSVYRPGQTVFFKCLLIDEDGMLRPNEVITLILENSSRSEITKMRLKTNEFGSVAGEFILPKSGLLGNYKILAETNLGSSVEYFKVEEYKRPTFEITFDKIDKTYSYDKKVVIKGYAKNFSGISLQNTDVSYSVHGSPYSFWSRSSNNTFFRSGKLKTNTDGSFEISFTPEKVANQSIRLGANDIQKYTLDVSATDLNGETQSGKLSLLVGDVSMMMNINIPNQIEKNDLTNIKIEAFNLSGSKIETSGRYKIYKVLESDSIESLIEEGVFKTGIQTNLANLLKRMKSGRYCILLTAVDSFGKEVEAKRDFIIFSYQDKKPPIQTNEWLVVKNSEFNMDLPAEIVFGVSDKDIRVVYELYNNDKVFDRKYLTISDENKKITIPYLSEYGDQVYLALTYLKNEKFYNKHVLLEKKQIKYDKKLKLKFEVFRDKLLPGQQETWTISVKNGDNNPVFAEVLASMYDKSLDKIYPARSWDINYPNTNIPFLLKKNYQPELGNRYYNNNTRYSGWHLSRVSRDEFHFDKLKLFGLDFRFFPEELLFQTLAGSQYEGVSSKTFVGYVRTKQNKPDDSLNTRFGEQEQIQIRSNFNETAFFYPQLRTNSEGETLITFTVPESNTQWGFRALAHDKNINSGTLEESVVTRKELMITPNMPRFIRQGDKTNISSKVSNLSDNSIIGKVRIEFFDPTTERIIDLGVSGTQQDFNLEKGTSSSVNWTFDVPNDLELLGCRIIAGSETFSDGEQHVLPVLSNRLLVTETMPFDVTEKGKSSFTFESLKDSKSNSLSNYRLTLEYSANPVWYAVMALPKLSNPQSDNSVAWFASYYVNTLGASIVRQYPQIANMISAWKAEGANKGTLTSKLNENEELKNIILSETPWILEANSQTEQMNKLSLLFDLNNTQQQMRVAVEKLQAFQDDMGGWSWFKGFYPSRSITLYILSSFAHLQQIGQVEYDAEIKEMQIRALNFIDKEIVSDFEQLKKHNKNWATQKTLSTTQMEYLYVRSYYRDIPITKEAREAERFYMDIATKNWTKLDLYERSLIITPLLQNGNKSLVQDIANSIRERAVIDKSKGMYWPNNTNSLFRNGMTVIHHTFYMDALHKTGADDKEMDLMKQWLIKQKQTQQWNTTHGTIDAIYALISSGTNWFEDDTDSTVIEVGKEKINMTDASLGTGYIKTSWGKAAITKNKSTVIVEKNSTNQPSYGALYWQYFEDLDKIKAHKTNLNVSKELFKEVKDSAGNTTLISVTNETPLKIGDKVTFRLVLKIDNDMDYVQLKDMRASCFEPIETTSGVRRSERTIYYQETRDASTIFYFEHLNKGTYVFNYSSYVNRIGTYSNGITSIQSIYAPEFASQTQGMIVKVEE